MANLKIHKSRKNGNYRVTICDTWSGDSSKTQMTSDNSKVTCKYCLNKIKKQASDPKKLLREDKEQMAAWWDIPGIRKVAIQKGQIVFVHYNR